MAYIDKDKLIRDLIDNRSFYPTIVKNAIENAPIEDVVPRSEVEKMAMVAAQMMVDEIRIQVAKHTDGYLPLFPNTEEEFTKYIEQFIEVFKKYIGE